MAAEPLVYTDWNLPLYQPRQLNLPIQICVAWLVFATLTLFPANRLQAQKIEIDVDALRAGGFEVVVSRHLTLVTDAKHREDVKQFNEVFDKAVDQWCDYFAIPRKSAENWHVNGLVIDKIDRFRAAGLIPDTLPPFPAGYQVNGTMWMFVKDGDYYTRHLLLHEGTHAFMEEFLKGFGPAWYAEGMAELLALHQWKDGTLKLRHSLTSRDDAPYWGRIKLIRTDRNAGNAMGLDEVLEMPGESFRQVRAYGWAWAVCEFFDSHPEFQATFRKLPSLANQRPAEFNRQLREALASKWELANREWQSMIDEAEYGYDVAKAATAIVSNREQSGREIQFELAVDRGWQDTQIDLAVGDQVQVTASGQFQVKRDSQPWISEANGVTLEYYRGRPLGCLIGAVRSADDEELPVVDFGNRSTWKADRAGRLLLRINESPAAWQDNEGSLQVTVRPLGK